jgi:CRISPR type I-E-associated protein CasB/Cse2
MREVAKTDERGGAERRFIAILGCSLDELPYHLRRAVGLLKSKSMAIDWAQLLADIRQWEDEDRHVQSDWARAFWSEIPQEGEQWTEKLTQSEDAL